MRVTTDDRTAERLRAILEHQRCLDLLVMDDGGISRFLGDVSGGPDRL